MKYGKIRIEDGNFIFSKHMMMNYLPCRDILWAYKHKEGVEGGQQKQFSTSSLVIITRRKKRYQFDMTDKEIQECLQLLKALNPKLVTGYPRGSRIALKSLPNTRDLGAIATNDGRHIIPKKLLRSGSLYHISMADQDILEKEYHLSEVIDFRTKTECVKKPDTLIDGCKYIHMPIVDEETIGITQNRDPLVTIMNFKETPEKLMIKQYENLVHDDYSVKQYARFLDALIHHDEGSVLWHCSAGKDRVGVGTAILLYALGVPKSTIYEDYLKTNVYLETDTEYIIRYLEANMIVDYETMDKIRVLCMVKEEYLDAVFNTIRRDYGSMGAFVRKALYMTPKSLEMLRNKYLV